MDGRPDVTGRSAGLFAALASRGRRGPRGDAAQGDVGHSQGAHRDLHGFLSAPFLAIAVYYLLQVAASTVNQPILVVIAFASGLMSNTVVGAIIAFADRVLHRAQQPPEDGENGQRGGGGGGGEGAEGGDPGHGAEGDGEAPGRDQPEPGR